MRKTLGLPQQIKYLYNNIMEIVYDAAGQKVSYIDHSNSSQSKIYHRGMIYKNGELTYMTLPEGYYDGSSYYATISDYLGSVRVVLKDNPTAFNLSAEVKEINHYDPWGVEFGMSEDPFGVQDFKHQGKERMNLLGKNVHDHGARLAFDGRWGSMDPLMEKYYSVSPYAHCNNNPIRYIDPDGKEIRVAEEYRKLFMNDIRNVYGNKANMFSFNEKGALQLDGKVKDFKQGMTRDQKQAFKGLSKAMSDKQVTSVAYANSHDVTVGGETKSIDIVQEYGGGLYSKTDNLIVIAPNVGTVEVNLTLEDWQATGHPTQKVQQNTTSTLFHEIGERNTNNINFRGGVIDFENYVRRVIGLPERPYDLYHTIK